MKENVGIARYLPQRILHATRTSRGCARLRLKLRRDRPISVGVTLLLALPKLDL